MEHERIPTLRKPHMYVCWKVLHRLFSSSIKSLVQSAKLSCSCRKFTASYSDVHPGNIPHVHTSCWSGGRWIVPSMLPVVETVRPLCERPTPMAPPTVSRRNCRSSGLVRRTSTPETNWALWEETWTPSAPSTSQVHCNCWITLWMPSRWTWGAGASLSAQNSYYQIDWLYIFWQYAVNILASTLKWLQLSVVISWPPGGEGLLLQTQEDGDNRTGGGHTARPQDSGASLVRGDTLNSKPSVHQSVSFWPLRVKRW